MRSATGRTDTQLNRTVRNIMLSIVVLISLVLLLLWRADNPRLERLRMEVVDAFAPSMGWVAGPIDVGLEVAQDYRNFIDVYAQNRTLRREIQSLKAWRERARVLEEENAELRALNNVRLTPRTTFVTGDVLADSGGPFLQSALVNVGRDNGVRDGAAAVDGSGLVGRVVGVGRRASRLLLLTDFSSRVPVMIQPGGRRGILAGDGTTAPVLEFIDEVDQLGAGEIVETSGTGGIFPPDLPVGRVIATQDGKWRVALLANYGRLEFVRLLRYQPDTEIDQPGGLIVGDPEIDQALVPAYSERRAE